MKGQTARRPLRSLLAAATTVATRSAASSPEKGSPACTTCLPKKPKKSSVATPRLLQQAILGENSIALKAGTAEQRLEKAKKLAEQIKREIMERREAKQDDIYNGNGNS
jgi:glutamine synthetase type III